MNLRTALIGAVLAGSAITPLVASATPASASEGINNCIVTALRPETGFINGARVVRGVTTVYCGYARNVNLQIGVREADSNGAYDTMYAPTWQTPSSIGAGQRVTWKSPWAPCRNTELGNEEVYTLARISVNGYVSNWDSGRDGAQLSADC